MGATTVIARWSSASTQSALPALASSITRSNNGIATGRYTVQIRSFRLPSSQTTGPKGGAVSRIGGIQEMREIDDGRNMFVVRSTNAPDEGFSFIEDPVAPSRDMMIPGAESNHTKWSTITLPNPDSTLLFPFDVLLQRVLCTPPHTATPTVGAWAGRTTQILIEGYSFTIGSDWIVRIGGVQIKGGGNAAGSRGLIIEATYLPVPTLPVTYNYARDFLLSLLPPAIVATGEVTWLNVAEEDLAEAGLSMASSATNDAEEQPWEEIHSAFTYVKSFKREGML